MIRSKIWKTAERIQSELLGKDIQIKSVDKRDICVRSLLKLNDSFQFEVSLFRCGEKKPFSSWCFFFCFFSQPKWESIVSPRRAGSTQPCVITAFAPTVEQTIISFPCFLVEQGWWRREGFQSGAKRPWKDAVCEVSPRPVIPQLPFSVGPAQSEPKKRSHQAGLRPINQNYVSSNEKYFNVSNISLRPERFI